MSEDNRQYAKVYFDFIESQAFDELTGNALKLYLRMRRYVCRARSGHSLSDFYNKGHLAVSGYLGQYAEAFGVNKSSISRWLKELEDAKFLITYYKAVKNGGSPNVWLLGRAVHIEGSKYALDVFFADHDAMAQEPDSRAALVFDQSRGDEMLSEMKASAKIVGIRTVAPTVAPVQRSAQQSAQRSNREEVIDKKNSKSLSKKAKAPPEPEQHTPADYVRVYHYKGKPAVRCHGKVNSGPWSVECPSCGDQVSIDHIGSPGVECLCGMHEIQLTKIRINETKLKHPAVDAFYRIASAYLRYGSLDPAWEDEIGAVEDIERWRLVVKQYIEHGWDVRKVANILVYYNENRLPGTRKKKEEPFESKTVVVDGVEIQTADIKLKGLTRR